MDSENVKNQEQNTADQTTGNSESYGRAGYEKEKAKEDAARAKKAK